MRPLHAPTRGVHLRRPHPVERNRGQLWRCLRSFAELVPSISRVFLGVLCHLLRLVARLWATSLRLRATGLDVTG